MCSIKKIHRTHLRLMDVEKLHRVGKTIHQIHGDIIKLNPILRIPLMMIMCEMPILKKAQRCDSFLLQ